jgi:hypothetical protein
MGHVVGRVAAQRLRKGRALQARTLGRFDRFADNPRIPLDSNSANAASGICAEHFLPSGGKMSRCDDVVIAATVGKKWIGLNRRPAARIYGD